LISEEKNLTVTYSKFPTFRVSYSKLPIIQKVTVALWNFFGASNVPTLATITTVLQECSPKDLAENIKGSQFNAHHCHESLNQAEKRCSLEQVHNCG
jgi:hypothetical protein